MPDPVLISITGATGQVYGVRALELLADTEYDTHLILSNAAKINLNQEKAYSVGEVEALADEVYNIQNVGAAPASGSFRLQGMLIAPCSMKTLSNIAVGNAHNLTTRAADVMLKERKPLVVMPREKPFNRIHLQNMLDLTDAGGIVFPPFPSFYYSASLDEMITRTVARAITHLDIDIDFEQWTGLSSEEP